MNACPPHHWLLDKSGQGKCRKCGEEKQFDLTIPGVVDLGPYHPPGGLITRSTFTPEERRKYQEYLDEQAKRIPE